MSLLKNEKQKDNLAKFLYDIAKIIIAIIVVSPIVQPEKFDMNVFVAGFVVSFLFFIFAYFLDQKQIE